MRNIDEAVACAESGQMCEHKQDCLSILAEEYRDLKAKKNQAVEETKQAENRLSREISSLEASVSGLQEEVLRLKGLLDLAKKNASSWIDKHKALEAKYAEALEAAGRGKP